MKGLFRRLMPWVGGTLLVSVFMGITCGVCVNVQRYDAYLSGLKSLTAHIEQKDAKGNMCSGVLYIKKPGCLRLIYQPEGGRELIADGNRLIQYDGRTKESDSIALSSTPLHFLLRDSGSLADHATIHKVIPGRRWTQIVLTSKEDPEDGEVTLVFQEAPLQLVRWIIKDPQGRKTVVTLSKIHRNAPIESRIFRMRK